MINRDKPVEIVLENGEVWQAEIINQSEDDGILTKRVRGDTQWFEVFDDAGDSVIDLLFLKNNKSKKLRNVPDKPEETKKEKMQKLLNELQELIAKDE